MSNLAVKIQEQQKRTSQQDPRKAVLTRRKARISMGEKCLAVVFAGAVLFCGVKIVSNNASLYDVNVEIQKLEASIQEQSKKNEDLQVQVKELSTYERIWAKAQQLGLKLNEKNVKSVQD